MMKIREVMNSQKRTQFVSDIKGILSDARNKAYSTVNTAMVQAYWLVGKRIVEEEQDGENRAAYGKEILKTLAEELSNDFGKGFDERELRKIRQFYLTFPEKEIRDAVSPELKNDSLSNETHHLVFFRLSWTHIRLLLRVHDENARNYYIKETVENNWSTRTLDRNISTQYYHRLLASQVKETVVKEMEEKTKSFQSDKFEFIKNPSVLEFLNLPADTAYTEQELETALIDNLQKFLLELGKGYAFVERQQLIRTETSDFYIDLVFYNYFLKCFVIVELKTHKLTHQDIGQLDMYVRMYDELKRTDSDNPTIGILLCTETDKTIAKYSVLNENRQLFTSKYLSYLPTEEELAAEIEREKDLIRLQLKQKSEK